MNLRKISVKSALILTFLFLLRQLSAGESLEITDFYLHRDFIYISIKSDFSNKIDIKKIIHDGINVYIDYYIEIFEKLQFPFPDRQITNLTISFEIAQDFINNGYEVIESREGTDKGLWFDKMDDMFLTLMNIDNVKLIYLENVNDLSEYYFDAHLEVTSLKLYPPLSIIYNLIGKWNFTSKKIRSRLFNKYGIITE